MRQRHQLFLAVFIFRLVNAFTLKTFFQPDEFYQAWEPANPGGYLTWEWELGIRTSLIPLIFHAIIVVSRTLGCSHLIIGNIVMALVAASADMASALVVSRFAGPGTFGKGLALSLGSGFNWMCSTRPFSNTFEYALTALALALWPLREGGFRWPRFIIANLLAQLSIALRPSNGLYWTILGIYSLWIYRDSAWKAILLISGSVGLITQGIILVTDMAWYNRPVWPFWAFLKTNFGDHVSELYGVMPWHFYVSQALPLLLLGYLPLAYLGIKTSKRILLVTVGINLLAFSMVAHKELRFIYFLLPSLEAIAAGARTKYWWRWFTLLLPLNIAFGLYFGMVHQRGVRDVMPILRDDPSLLEVSFLMPCHSTPWSAHLERPDVAAKSLSCDPPYFVSDKTNYVDVADQFYIDPTAFLSRHPEYLSQTVVAFESLNFQKIADQLDMSYSLQKRLFNSHFHDDWRRKGDVIVYRRNY